MTLPSKGNETVTWLASLPFSRDPDPLSGAVVGQWDKTHGCYGSRQTFDFTAGQRLTSDENSAR